MCDPTEGRRCGTADRAQYDGCRRVGHGDNFCLMQLTCDTTKKWVGDVYPPHIDTIIPGQYGGGDLGAGLVHPATSSTDVSRAGGPREPVGAAAPDTTYFVLIGIAVVFAFIAAVAAVSR